MDENIIINELVNEDNNEVDVATEEKDELTKAVEAQMEKLRRQAMLLGGQAICSAILQNINIAMRKPGKRSYRDYERLIKEISDFCTTGMSRKVNLDGTISPIEEDSEINTTEE